MYGLIVKEESRCVERSRHGPRLSPLLASCAVESPRVGNYHCEAWQVNWQCAASSTSVASPTLQSRSPACCCEDGDAASRGLMREGTLDGTMRHIDINDLVGIESEGGEGSR